MAVAPFDAFVLLAMGAILARTGTRLIARAGRGTTGLRFANPMLARPFVLAAQVGKPLPARTMDFTFPPLLSSLSMDSPVRASLLMAVTLFTAACSSPSGSSAPTPLSAAALDSVRAVDVAFAAAMNAKDSTAAYDIYAADAVVMPQDAPAMDMAAARPMLKSMIDGGATDFVLKSNTAYGVGDLAYMTGAVTYNMAGASHTMKFVEVLRRGADGKWRYVVDAFSNVGPPAAPAAPAK